MLDKIEVGKKYLNADKIKVEILFVGDNLVVWTANNVESSTPKGYVMNNWSELPAEKEEWYQVAAYSKSCLRPYIFGALYRNKKDFLGEHDVEESDYHWIKLIKVELD